MSAETWTRDRPMDPEAEAAWDAFVLGDSAESHPAGTIFHSLVWQKVLDRTYGLRYYHLAARAGGRIRGTLSLYRYRSPTGRKTLISLPYTVYGGMLAADPEAARLLHDRALELAKETKAGMVQLRNTVPSGLDLPGTDLHVYFLKELGRTPEECLEAIPRKSRATVRKAMSQHGLEYEVNRDWETLWRLHAVNLKRLGTPVFPKAYFRNILETLGPSADILFVKYQGKPVCGVMTFYYRDVCNPYFSGSLTEYNFTGANNYMYYALMCHGLARGCRKFDFGKSRRDTGAYQFKCNMGFEPAPLPYQFICHTRSELPSFNPSNPKLALFIKAWSLQPLWTSKLLGSWLNRYLP